MAVTVTVPPSTTKLIALADRKAILSITDSANDTLLGHIIQRGSDAVTRFCNRVEGVSQVLIPHLRLLVQIRSG
jgi:hypothetical protein